MDASKWLLVIGWSLACPGAGHAVVGRRRAMLVWAIAGAVATLALLVTVWASLAMWIVRLGATADAVVRILRMPVAERRWGHGAFVPTAIGLFGGAFAMIATHAYAIPSAAMEPTLHVGDRVLTERVSLLWRAPERGEIVVFAHPCDGRTFIKRVIAVGGDTVEVRCGTVYVNGQIVWNELVEDSATCRYKDLVEDRRGTQRSVETCSRYRETIDRTTYEVLQSSLHPKRVAAGLDGGHADFPKADQPAPSCAGVPGAAPVADQPKGTIVVLRADDAGCLQQRQLRVPEGALFLLGDNRSNSNDSRYWGLVPVEAVEGRLVGRYHVLGPGWWR